MPRSTFKREVYEIAFGDDALKKQYTEAEVTEQLFKMSQELIKFTEYLKQYVDEELERGHEITVETIENAKEAWDGGAGEE